jgi:hypothetical protein
MKKLIVFALLLVILVGAGYGAYRLGLLSRFLGGGATGSPPSTETAAGAMQPVAEGGQAGAPAGGTVAEGPPPAPPVVQPTIGQPGQGVANKSIEVRVVNVRTAPSIGDVSAAQGREFVIVDTSWKNLIPKVKVNRKKAQDRTAGMGALGFGGGATDKDRAEDEANTTIESVAFEVPELPKHLWLVVDSRLAEPIDEDATNALDAHLGPDKIGIREFEQVVTGGIAFQAPAGAQSLALLYLDSANGHLLLPIKGELPALASSLGGGSSRSNEIVDLAVTGAAWAEAEGGTPGLKTLVVSVKGISRQNAIADIPFGEFGFLQTDLGCVAQPDEQSTAVKKPLAPVGRFLPMVPNEGQLAFTVPADTRSAVLMLRARSAAPIELPALGDGSVRKPAASATHQDGKVLRVSVVGTGTLPAGLQAPPAGSEHLVVDYLVENLTSGSGLELQPKPQFALADAAGTKYEPVSEGVTLPCGLTGENVVPAGGWRRFSLLYTVPVGQPLTLEYRGFESTGTLKVR